MEIEKLNSNETLQIRHEVLWPNEYLSYCEVEGDQEAQHFGISIDQTLVCVASIFTKDRSARLRKFCTLQNHQGKGIGGFMLNYLIEVLKNEDIDLLWFNARVSAMEFYKRFGFNSQGECFYINEVPYFKMYMHLNFRNKICHHGGVPD